MLDSIIRVKPGIATKNQKSKIKNLTPFQISSQLL